MNTNEMKADTNVLAHIQRENAERVAQATAEGWTWYGVASEGMASKYANVYEYERSMATSEYSDMYKERNGFRPRFDVMPTLEEVNALIENMPAYDSEDY